MRSDHEESLEDSKIREMEKGIRERDSRKWFDEAIREIGPRKRFEREIRYSE